MELKLFEKKLDFLNLFGNWSPEDYLKIGVLGVKYKDWNFGDYSKVVFFLIKQIK